MAMTKKKMIKYATNNGFNFTGEKNRKDMYEAKNINGVKCCSPTLDGLKRMIDLALDDIKK